MKKGGIPLAGHYGAIAGRKSMKCTRVRQVIFLYADNEMGEDLVLAFEEHLVLCPGCAREADNARRLLALLRQRCVRAPAPARLRRRILTSLPHRRSQARESWD